MTEMSKPVQGTLFGGEFFVDQNMAPRPPGKDLRQQPAFFKALAFFEENLVTKVIDGVVRKGYIHLPLWEFLGKPYGESRDWEWWNKKVTGLKLKNNKNFWVCSHKLMGAKTGRGGHNRKLYLICPADTREIVGTDGGDEAKAYREALWVYAERFRDSDPELIRDMMERTEDPRKIEEAMRITRDRYIGYYLRIGKEWEWIEERLKGMSPRKEWTDALKDRDFGRAYGQATNLIYSNALGKTANQIRVEQKVPDSRPARDGLSPIELTKVRLSELIITETLKNNDSIRGRACLDVCAKESAELRHIGAHLRKD